MGKRIKSVVWTTAIFSVLLLVGGCGEESPYGGSSMGGFGGGDMLTALIALLVIGAVFMKGRGSTLRIPGPTLIIRRLKIDESPSAEALVEMAGRASGLIAWLLTLLGFDAEMTLRVTKSRVTIKSASLSGEIHQVAPLPSLASTHCGYAKPAGLLILGVVVLFMGFLVHEIPWGIVIAAGLLAAYWLTKKITIAFETNGGTVLGLSFKRSVVDTINIDIEQALKIIQVVNENVVKSQNRGS